MDYIYNFSVRLKKKTSFQNLLNVDDSSRLGHTNAFEAKKKSRDWTINLLLKDFAEILFSKFRHILILIYYIICINTNIY